MRELIPEIKFENAWKDSNPVLVEHLLEHTTGWDELHLVEYSQKGSKLLTLREALDFHPHSRVSRWPPGSRMAYCNTGPNVAAYIVEKLTGETYEAYIQKNFFVPMGSTSMTYRKSKTYENKGATLYKEGRPSEYWHMMMRASGSINASAEDMAKLVELMLRRGMVDSVRILPAHAFKRMETPASTTGAGAGMRYGYGLCIYSSPHNGHIYFKHGGGVGNGISDFSYLPEHGVGYSILINSGNASAIRKLSELVRDFQTRQLPEPDAQTSETTFSGGGALTGYYHEINPETDIINLPPLTASKVWARGDSLFLQRPAWWGETEAFLAVDAHRFQSVKTNRIELVAVTDPLAGGVLELANRNAGTITFGSISGAYVIARLLIVSLWLILMLCALVSVPVWLIRFWMGKISGGANILIRIWPLLPIVFLMGSFVLLGGGGMDGIEPLAQPSIFSVGFMLGTIAFLVSAVFSLVMAWRYRHLRINRFVYAAATLLAGLHCTIALYLSWYGIIGMRTWA